MTESDQGSVFSIQSEMSGAEDAVAEYFAALPEEVFFDGSEAHWSPAHHLSHLNITHRTLSASLQQPKAALLDAFGKSERQSRSYDEVRETYRAALAAGGKAPARYIPVLSGESQAQLVSEFRRATQDLRAAAEWSEADLDSYLLPHALLGKLTVREMLYFAAYHQRHHLDGVQRNLRRKESEPTE